jgi:hypothetical protein
MSCIAVLSGVSSGINLEQEDPGIVVASLGEKENILRFF